MSDSGDTTWFSKVCREKSGGETQTPYYVAIVASFVQLYRAHTNQDSARLLVFDEAFNRMDVDYIISIENLTAYYEFLAHRCDRYLAVYLGGYPGPARREFLARLARWTDDRGRRPVFLHWGDLDYGGFSIFRHLQATAVPHLQPLWMDKTILTKYRSYGSPLTPGYARRLAWLATEPAHAAFHPVIQAMLSENLRLEQECITVEVEEIPL